MDTFTPASAYAGVRLPTGASITQGTFLCLAPVAVSARGRVGKYFDLLNPTGHTNEGGYRGGGRKTSVTTSCPGGR